MVDDLATQDDKNIEEAASFGVCPNGSKEAGREFKDNNVFTIPHKDTFSFVNDTPLSSVIWMKMSQPRYARWMLVNQIRLDR